jgi:hypothetical protein
MTMKTIPKSLHTITVLVAVARHMLASYETADQAIAAAVILLGYKGAPDEYQLASKARAILAKSVRS